MNELMYQNVFNEIQNDLPEQWKRVILFAAYTEGSFSVKYYYSVDGSKYRDCYSSKNLDITKLLQRFMKINNILSTERDLLALNKRWNVMTLVVEETGEFKADFDYEDVSENMISYEQSWKKKYLK